jgi:hypothetical protein
MSEAQSKRTNLRIRKSNKRINSPPLFSFFYKDLAVFHSSREKNCVAKQIGTIIHNLTAIKLFYTCNLL